MILISFSRCVVFNNDPSVSGRNSRSLFFELTEIISAVNVLKVSVLTIVNQPVDINILWVAVFLIDSQKGGHFLEPQQNHLTFMTLKKLNILTYVATTIFYRGINIK